MTHFSCSADKDTGIMCSYLNSSKDINYDIYNQWRQETNAVRLNHWNKHDNLTLKNNTSKRHIYINTPQFLWDRKFSNYKTFSPLHNKFWSTKQSMRDIVSNLPQTYVNTIKKKLTKDVHRKKTTIVQSNDIFNNYNYMNTINTNNTPLSMYQQSLPCYPTQYYQ
eukprot:539229_1